MKVENYIQDGLIRIRVRPNAHNTKIKGYDETRDTLLVDVAAPPDKNKANIEIIKFFSKKLGKKVEIKRGLTSRDKVLIVD